VSLFFPSRRRHTRCYRDWSSDVCSSDLLALERVPHRQCGHAPEVFPLERTTLPRPAAMEPHLVRDRLDLILRQAEVPERATPARSEERRVGKEWSSQWAAEHGTCTLVSE